MYRYSLKHSATAHIVLVATFAVASGCGMRSVPSIPQRADRSIITQDEAAYANAATAHDIVEHLRPEFLVTMTGRSPVGERLVYINGVRAGGLEVLEDIPAERVQEIRLLGAREASRLLGGGHSAGALMIKLRRGWYPRT